MLLRAYAEGDFDHLHALDQVCFSPEIAYSKQELRGFLTSPSAFTAVALEASDSASSLARILGFAIVRNIRQGTGAALHIITIDVDPSRRRQGVGRLLMQWMEERARALGSASMRLEVCEQNAEALRFYKAAGFEVTGRIAGYYAPRLDALVMERPLAPSPTFVRQR